MPTATAPAPQASTAQGLFQSSAAEKKDFAAKLRQQTIACRVHRQKFGVRKVMTREQVRLIADNFDAAEKAISASKRLLDTRHPSYTAVTNILSQAVDFWRSMSTPYPDTGIRLIRKDAVDGFTKRMTQLASDLNRATVELQKTYAELRETARQQLGDLFNAEDYPASIQSEFSLDWDFPSIEPPAYLKNIHPDPYEQECERIRGRFEEAVRLTEQAFTAQFQKLVTHLADRLKGDVDGKPKKFQDSSVENLNAFFAEFKALDVGSNGELQQLVNKAQDAVNGITADDLRSDDNTRNDIGASIDAMMINKPKRAINLEDE